MPRAAMRICTQPGCGARCTGIYCAAHGASAQRSRDSRLSARERGYDSRHEQWRKLILHRDPLCKIAHFCGGMAPSVIADHVTPLRAGGDWSLENGQGCCKPCHDWKTRAIDMPRISEYQKGRLTPVIPSEHAVSAGACKRKAETATRDNQTVSGAADSGEVEFGGTLAVSRVRAHG